MVSVKISLSLVCSTLTLIMKFDDPVAAMAPPPDSARFESNVQPVMVTC